MVVHDETDSGSFHWHLAKDITPSELGSADIGVRCILDLNNDIIETSTWESGNPVQYCYWNWEYCGR